MKRASLSLILICCLAVISFAQLKGEYYHSTGFTGERIKFQSNNRFELTRSGCTYHAEGKGTYDLTDNKLTLRFEGEPKLQDSIKISRYQSKSDPSTISVSVSDRKTGESLIAASTYIKNPEGEFVAGAATDMDGRSVMKLTPSNDTLIFYVQYVGYRLIEYPIVPNNNYNIAVQMLYEFGKQFENGDTVVYKIRNIRKNSIELKGSYKDAEFETYMKR